MVLARKLKLVTFSRNWEISWLAKRKLFWVLPVERWKMSSWEGNVFSFVHHKLGWDMEYKLIDRSTLVR